MSGFGEQLQRVTASSWSFVRRNRRIIALLGATAAATGAAFAYFSYQYQQVVVSGLRRERELGLQSLWQQFEKNNATILELIQSLQKPMKDAVWRHTPVEDVLLRLRQSTESKADENDSRHDKKKLWEELRVLSITRLLGCMWALVITHVQLIARINLIARYTSSDGAGEMGSVQIKPLPGGKLRVSTQKSFLEGAKVQLTQSDMMGELLEKLQEIVEQETESIPLSKRLTAMEMSTLLKTISTHFLETKAPNPFRSVRNTTSDHGSDRNAQEYSDSNLDLLNKELCDVTEALDVDMFLQSLTDYVLEQVSKCLNDQMPENTDLPMAKVVPLLSTISNKIFVVDDMQDTSPTGEQDSDGCVAFKPLSQDLMQHARSKRFGAAIFLSGEQDYAA